MTRDRVGDKFRAYWKLSIGVTGGRIQWLLKSLLGELSGPIRTFTTLYMRTHAVPDEDAFAQYERVVGREFKK